MTEKFPPLYPIVDRSAGRGRGIYDLARAVLDGGARILQIREKQLSSIELFREAGKVVDYARRLGASVIVNDRIDIASAVDADGVHLGQDDLPPAAARRILGEGKIIGLSTHSMKEFEEALREPIDYVALGPVFETFTAGKKRPPLGLGLLRECRAGRQSRSWRSAASPGERTQRSRQRGGLRGVISALMGEEEIEVAVEAFLRVVLSS